MTMDDASEFQVYDHLLLEPLAKAGWQCDTLSWRNAEVDWNDYQLVMIRSPWDYQLHAAEFLSVLNSIEQSKAHLDNPLDIVTWNINKTYLRDLESKGVEIVPTQWFSSFERAQLEKVFAAFDSAELVVKPCVSAAAYDTFRLSPAQLTAQAPHLATIFAKREFMVQPFMANILTEGEFSLFYFDGEYSHAILKTPKQNDFRVQEEYGGRLLLIEPEAELRACAEKVLNAIDTSLLYARLDFVRSATGFALMEAELIEPSLYFNLDEKSPQRFVDAMERRMKRFGIID